MRVPALRAGPLIQLPGERIIRITAVSLSSDHPTPPRVQLRCGKGWPAPPCNAILDRIRVVNGEVEGEHLPAVLELSRLPAGSPELEAAARSTERVLGAAGFPVRPGSLQPDSFSGLIGPNDTGARVEMALGPAGGTPGPDGRVWATSDYLAWRANYPCGRCKARYTFRGERLVKAYHDAVRAGRRDLLAGVHV